MPRKAKRIRNRRNKDNTYRKIIELADASNISYKYVNDPDASIEVAFDKANAIKMIDIFRFECYPIQGCNLFNYENGFLDWDPVVCGQKDSKMRQIRNS